MKNAKFDTLTSFSAIPKISLGRRSWSWGGGGGGGWEREGGGLWPPLLFTRILFCFSMRYETTVLRQ